MSDTPNPDFTLADEDREIMRGALLELRAAGEPALIPADVDIDGDGLVDAFGLDENDEVVPILGVDLARTSYVSDGESEQGEAE